VYLYSNERSSRVALVGDGEGDGGLPPPRSHPSSRCDPPDALWAPLKPGVQPMSRGSEAEGDVWTRSGARAGLTTAALIISGVKNVL
jgi:hypothetical protein